MCSAKLHGDCNNDYTLPSHLFWSPCVCPVHSWRAILLLSRRHGICQLFVKVLVSFLYSAEAEEIHHGYRSRLHSQLVQSSRSKRQQNIQRLAATCLDQQQTFGQSQKPVHSQTLPLQLPNDDRWVCPPPRRSLSRNYSRLRPLTLRRIDLHRPSSRRSAPRNKCKTSTATFLRAARHMYARKQKLTHASVLAGRLNEGNGRVDVRRLAVILFFKVARDSFGSNKMCHFFLSKLGCHT